MIATSILAVLLVVAFVGAGLGQDPRRASDARAGRACGLLRRRLPADRRCSRSSPSLGLLLGLVAPLIGALAAVGLLLLLGGAVVVHLRNGDGLREVVPAVVLGVVTLTYLLLLLGDLR